MIVKMIKDLGGRMDAQNEKLEVFILFLYLEHVLLSPRFV